VSSGDALIVFGGNAAYPRELLQAVGGFDTRVGRKGGSLVSNDEALLWLQVKERGYRAFYHPQILIHHHVQAQRLNQRFVLRRMFWQGVSDEVTQQILQPPTLKGRIARASASARALSLSPRRIRNFLAAAANPALFSARCHYAYKLGRARGLLPLGL
jgi:hypothetical protein